MTVEAVLLTGGASRRMGSDKAKLPVGGETLAERLVRVLKSVSLPVTVLGREPIEGAAFLPDEEEFAGPLSALSRFKPCADTVFVLSCDMPLFDGNIVETLRVRIGDFDAAVPVAGGWRQPLCALYRANCFAYLFESDSLEERLSPKAKRGSMMGWLDSLRVVEVPENELGVDPLSLRGANTADEFEQLMTRSNSK